jgi:hypothetical protein
MAATALDLGLNMIFGRFRRLKPHRAVMRAERVGA